MVVEPQDSVVQEVCLEVVMTQRERERERILCSIQTQASCIPSEMQRSCLQTCLSIMKIREGVGLVCFLFVFSTSLHCDSHVKSKYTVLVVCSNSRRQFAFPTVFPPGNFSFHVPSLCILDSSLPALLLACFPSSLTNFELAQVLNMRHRHKLYSQYDICIEMCPLNKVK